MRLTLRLAAIAAGLIVCLLPHYGWRLAGRASPWPRLFLAWAGYCCGLRVRVVGRPLRRDVLFVSNHLSWLDILAVAGATGAAFVSKDEVARWPVIGWMARLNNTVFVARSDRRAVRDQADALRGALATGRAVALFPEGTTAGGHEVLPFRASLLASVMPPLPGLTVQPIAIDYGAAAEEIAWVGDEGAKANARRILSRPGVIPVTLHVLESVDPHDVPDRKALAEAARAEIIDALGASSGGPNPLYAAP